MWVQDKIKVKFLLKKHCEFDIKVSIFAVLILERLVH